MRPVHWPATCSLGFAKGRSVQPQRVRARPPSQGDTIMNVRSVIRAGWLTGAFALVPGIASAELEACGGVFVFGDADCEFRPTEECTEHCEVVAMETTCAAELYRDCESECTAHAETECQSSCQTSCETTCEEEMAAEEPPRCMGLAMSDCQQACNDKCADAEHVGSCRSACAHTCGAKCEGKCQDADEDVVCEEKCTTACDGSCEARANIDCQVECQTKVFEQCETRKVEECETQCTQTGGAIYCDDQFLSSGDLDACAAELSAEVEIDVDVDIEAEVDADADIDLDADQDDDGDVDKRDAKKAGNCAMSPGGMETGAATALLGALGLVGLRRRRRG